MSEETLYLHCPLCGELDAKFNGDVYGDDDTTDVVGTRWYSECCDVLFTLPLTRGDLEDMA